MQIQRESQKLLTNVIKGGEQMRLDRLKLFLVVKQNDLSQKRLAELSGVSRVTINNVMNGRSCSNDVAERIAYALNTPLSELREVVQ